MILDRILESVDRALVQRKQWLPLDDLELLAAVSPHPGSFRAALLYGGNPPQAAVNGSSKISIIAEVKRASPSRGRLNAGLDVAKLVGAYARGGAAAISVLTEPKFFEGSLVDLAKARRATELPLLRKDFIIDPYQVYEARVAGADALLLIASILPDARLRELLELARSLGMAVLVEVHTAADTDKALAAGADIVGINNRDLTDFSIDLAVTMNLRPLIPAGVIVVSESGIRSADDIARLESAGINAVLVGEALTCNPDPECKIRELLSNQRHILETPL